MLDPKSSRLGLLTFCSRFFFVLLAAILILPRETPASSIKATLDMGSLSCAGAPTDCEVAMVAKDLSTGCNSLGQPPIWSEGERLTKATASVLGRLRERTDQVLRASFHGGQGRNIQRIDLPEGLTKRDTWIQSAAWSKSGTDLLASDLTAKSLLQFSLPYGLVNEIKISSLSDGTEFRPSTIQARSDGYVIENGEGHLFWMTSDFSVRSDLLVGGVDGDQGFIASSAWSWIDSVDHLLIFGDRGRVGLDSSWSFSLMRFPVPNPTTFDTFTNRSLLDASRQFARLGFPILASAKGAAYMLLIDDTARIYRADSNPAPLNSFPREYCHVPEMPNIWSLEAMSVVYAKMVNAQTVAGLYGEGEFLYVLTRRPELASRTTVWNLFKIDPALDVILYSKRLPVDSAHLVLVPGSPRWAAIEKGPVKEPGKQNVLGIVLFSPDDLPKGKGAIGEDAAAEAFRSR